MKKFERFIIYPLLIVALFYSLPGEQITTATENVIDRLVVRELSVVNDEGTEVVNIGSSSFTGKSGRISVYNGRLGEKIYSTITSGNFEVVNTVNTDRRATLSFGGLSLRSEDYWSYITGNSITIQDYFELYELYDDDVPKRRYLDLSINDNGSGFLQISNNKGYPLLYLGPEGGNGHGLINIYDKYGEDWRSYNFR